MYMNHHIYMNVYMSEIDIYTKYVGFNHYGDTNGKKKKRYVKKLNVTVDWP
jgi:hypothetical protein